MTPSKSFENLVVTWPKVFSVVAKYGQKPAFPKDLEIRVHIGLGQIGQVQAGIPARKSKVGTGDMSSTRRQAASPGFRSSQSPAPGTQ